MGAGRIRRSTSPTSDASLFAYLDCLKHAFLGYRDRMEGADFAMTFDFLVMHTPFAGLVKAGHRKMMREFADASAGDRAGLHATGPSGPCVCEQVGNLCSGAVTSGSQIDGRGASECV